MGFANVLGPPVQSLISTGNLITWGLLLIIALTWWIKGMPDRRRADTEAEKSSGDQYAEQIKEFRKEVHGYRNALQVVQARLTTEESVSRQRGDRISMMMLIIHLLIGELRRHAPGSDVIGQAETLLSEIRARDDHDASSPLEMAQKTERAAKETVAAVRADHAE